MLEDPGRLLLLVVLQDAALVVLTVGSFWAGVFVARSLGRKPGYSLAALGLSRPQMTLFAAVMLGVLVGFGAVLLGAGVSAASAAVLERFGFSAENAAQEPLMQGLQSWVSDNPVLAITVAIFVVVLFVPAVEELVFRGALFGGLYRLGNLILRRRGRDRISQGAKRASLVLATLLSSAVFALLHFSPVIIPALFVFGLIMCVLYERTGSLLPPFAAHATFNAFTTLLIILAGLGVFDIPT